MNSLKKLIISYKNITEDLICDIQREHFEELDIMLHKRQTLIDTLQNLNYDHEDLTSLCKEMNLLELDQKLIEISNQKKKYLIEEIKKLNDNKKAGRVYNSMDLNGSIVSRRI